MLKRHVTLKYLGINLISPVGNLLKVNYVLLIKTFQQELDYMGKLYLAWSVRLAAYKISILLKLLYYFRTLPIHAPCFALGKEWLLNVSERIKGLDVPTISIKNRRCGGMGMQDLKEYNIAAFGFYHNILNLEVELNNQMC